MASFMGDSGLEIAIKAAGGVRALARQLEISQPAISTWKRIPADRVLSIEAATGVPRRVLRPDLYPAVEAAAGPDPVDAARADEYALLAALLWRAPTADLLKRLGHLKGDDSDLGLAHLELAQAAASAKAEVVQREFFDLFVGLGRGELLPYGSYYRTGFLHERPLAAVRDDLARLGIERRGRVAEPEDHIAVLCDVMSGLARGQFAAEGIDDRTFFARHLAPWAARFFADLGVARAASFYRLVGALGGILMAIEAEAFTLPA
jgi:TorA maturation chaperone TorD